MLAEVAHASLRRDREEKARAYGRAVIPEVWIADLIDKCVEIYRDPIAAGYGQMQKLLAGDKAQVTQMPRQTRGNFYAVEALGDYSGE